MINGKKTRVDIYKDIWPDNPQESMVGPNGEPNYGDESKDIAGNQWADMSKEDKEEWGGDNKEAFEKYYKSDDFQIYLDHLRSKFENENDHDNKGFTDKEIRMAFGILNDPRYKAGNYDGAYTAIEKISKGLATHPSVANALKRANESIKEDDYEPQLSDFTDPGTPEELAKELFYKGSNADDIQAKFKTWEDYMNSDDFEMDADHLRSKFESDEDRPDEEPYGIMQGEKEEIEAIFKKYPAEWAKAKETDEIEYDSKLKDELLDYYITSGEMPYGIMKARTGDPDEWIWTRLNDLGVLGESTIKPYVSMYKDDSDGKMIYDVLDKDGKSVFQSKDKEESFKYFKQNFRNLREDEGTDRAQHSIWRKSNPIGDNYMRPDDYDSEKPGTHIIMSQPTELHFYKVPAENYDKAFDKWLDDSATRPEDNQYYDSTKDYASDHQYWGRINTDAEGNTIDDEDNDPDFESVKGESMKSDIAKAISESFNKNGSYSFMKEQPPAQPAPAPAQPQARQADAPAGPNQANPMKQAKDGPDSGKLQSNISLNQIAAMFPNIVNQQMLKQALLRIKQGQNIGVKHAYTLADAFKQLIAKDPIETQKVMMMLKRIRAKENIETDNDDAPGYPYINKEMNHGKTPNQALKDENADNSEELDRVKRLAGLFSSDKE